MMPSRSRCLSPPAAAPPSSSPAEAKLRKVAQTIYRDRLSWRHHAGGPPRKDELVVKEMENWLAALGFSWRDVNETQAYTVHDIGSLVGPEIVQRGAAPVG